MSVVVLGQHRAYEGSDTPMDAWLRDDAGPLALGDFELIEVLVGRQGEQPMTLPATIDGDGTNGRVSWTITAGDIRRRLGLLGLFRLSIRADGRTVYTANLSVVA